MRLFQREQTLPAVPAEKPVFSVSLLISGINTGTCATFLINKPVFTIGKAGTCDAILDFSEEISREHAVIKWEEGQYTITDLNSMNGTFLNGSRLQPNAPQTVKEGDRIGISTFLFAVERIKQ